MKVYMCYKKNKFDTGVIGICENKNLCKKLCEDYIKNRNKNNNIIWSKLTYSNIYKKLKLTVCYINNNFIEICENFKIDIIDFYNKENNVNKDLLSTDDLITYPSEPTFEYLATETLLKTLEKYEIKNLDDISTFKKELRTNKFTQKIGKYFMNLFFDNYEEIIDDIQDELIELRDSNKNNYE